MAFCDNPKCRWHNASGCGVIYVESEPLEQAPFDIDRVFDPFAPVAKFTLRQVKNHLFVDNYNGNAVLLAFCDKCKPLADNAMLDIKIISVEDKSWFASLIQDHGDNLLLHFVQSEWLEKEKAKKKSQS